MRARLLLGIAVASWLTSPLRAQSASPSPEEMAQARQWTAAKLANGGQPFFSFTYGGKPSAELLKGWEFERASRRLDQWRTQHTLTYTDPKTGLLLRCVGVEYADFPAGSGRSATTSTRRGQN